MVKIYKHLITCLLAAAALQAGRGHAASLILHHTSFDGGLYWTCPIVKLQISEDFQIQISIYHETKYNSFENSIYSQWKIAGLETYIARDGVDKLIWCSPAGDKVSFKIKPSSNQRSVDSEGCRMSILSEDARVVTDREGRSWSYQRGELVRVSLDDGSDVYFKSKNGLIKEIKKDGRIILQAKEIGATLLLLVDGHQKASITYDTSGELIDSVTFEKFKRPSLRFTYEAGNVVGISECNKAIYKFVWRETALLDSFLTLLKNPKYLYSDGYYKYNHEYILGVARLSARDKLGRQEVKIFNLQTRTITDKNLKS